MSEEQLKAFIAKAKDDQSIQVKLKAAKTADDVVGIAKEHGHEFIREHMAQLSENDLEVVAGGGYNWNAVIKAASTADLAICDNALNDVNACG